MLQNQFANYGDQMFDKDTAKIVRNHAFWAAIVMSLPLFGLNLIIYCIILWDMYVSLNKRACCPFNWSSIIVGFIVNVFIALAIDTVLTFIPIIGWLGTAFTVYLQFYFSGKTYIETIKNMKD